MRRNNTIVGVALVALAAAAVVDLAPEAVQAVRRIESSWPYALILLAGAAALSTLAELRQLLGPLVLAALGSVTLVVRAPGGIGEYWPPAIAAAGIAFVVVGASTATPGRLLAVVFTARRTPRDELPSRIRIVCFVGVVKLDLRDTQIGSNKTLSVTALLGHVEVKIPAHWPVLLDTAPGLVSIDERGRRDSIQVSGPKLLIDAGGLAGSIVVERY